MAELRRILSPVARAASRRRGRKTTSSRDRRAPPAARRRLRCARHERRRGALRGATGLRRRRAGQRAPPGRAVVSLAGGLVDGPEARRTHAREYPGLTIVGGCAIAFGIAAGPAGFEGLTQLASPRPLPLAARHRIVAINHLDLQTVRTAFTAVEHAGGYRTVERNLMVGDSAPEPIALAEISASAFDVARQPHRCSDER